MTKGLPTAEKQSLVVVSEEPGNRFFLSSAEKISGISSGSSVSLKWRGSSGVSPRVDLYARVGKTRLRLASMTIQTRESMEWDSISEVLRVNAALEPATLDMEISDVQGTLWLDSIAFSEPEDSVKPRGFSLESGNVSATSLATPWTRFDLASGQRFQITPLLVNEYSQPLAGDWSWRSFGTDGDAQVMKWNFLRGTLENEVATQLKPFSDDADSYLVGEHAQFMRFTMFKPESLSFGFKLKIDGNLGDLTFFDYYGNAIPVTDAPSYTVGPVHGIECGGASLVFNHGVALRSYEPLRGKSVAFEAITLSAINAEGLAVDVSSAPRARMQAYAPRRRRGERTASFVCTRQPQLQRRPIARRVSEGD